MDEYYGMFWALYFSNDRSIVMHEAWTITKECAVINFVWHLAGELLITLVIITKYAKSIILEFLSCRQKQGTLNGALCMFCWFELVGISCQISTNTWYGPLMAIVV